MGLPTNILAAGLLGLLSMVLVDGFLFARGHDIGPYPGFHQQVAGPLDFWYGGPRRSGYRGPYRGPYRDYRGYYRDYDSDEQYRHSRESQRHSDESRRSSDESYRRSDESRRSSDESYRRSDESHGSSDESYKRRDESHGSSDESHGRSDESHGHDRDAKHYRFMIGTDFGPYEYVDDDGLRKGFHVDLLKAVCAEAKQQCNWLLDRYSNCWDHDTPGVGLLGNWYDACLGAYPTPERSNSFNFSVPFTTNFHVTLHYKRGGSAQGHALDLAGRKIGFVNGWSMSPACLARQSSLRGNQPEDYTAVYYNSLEDLMKAIQGEEIDAILGMPEYIPPSTGLMSVGPQFYCTDAGTAVMARYSQQPLLDWWNEAFERMRTNGDLRRLCEQAQRDHGSHGTIHCVE